MAETKWKRADRAGRCVSGPTKAILSSSFFQRAPDLPDFIFASFSAYFHTIPYASRALPAIMTTPHFDITPEKEASPGQYFYRQLFVKPRSLTKNEAGVQGKTAIVTGSNIGLGLEAAHQLLDLGLSKLILAVRDVAKGESARKRLLSGRNAAAVVIEVWSLDLDSYDSILAFAERAKTLERLDIAILNAGLFKATEVFHPLTGIEMDVQINYVSNAILSVLLLPALKKSGSTRPGRLVLVSSDMAAWAKFEERSSKSILGAFKEKATKWDFAERYSTSKLLGQFFVTELAKRVPASSVTVNLVNPGFTYGSELQREGKGTLIGFLFGCFARVVGRSITINARNIVHAAANFDAEVHGQYVEDAKLRPKAPILYKPEGEALTKQIWEETLAEGSFANLRDIVAGFKA
ncbi:Short chain dehydrogenase virG [Paramyrothecium foliicola]|nr:Short chain dehydrogenase virG [Paramyrothecium foliicola]